MIGFVLASENLRDSARYSRHDATTANAAIAAVSARSMRGPSDTARQPFASNSASSSGAHPPSGPIAISSVGISASAAADRFVQCVAQRGRALLLGQHEPRRRRCCTHAFGQCNRHRESPAHLSAATAARPHARCAAIVPTRFCAACARCFSVRRAITGAMARLPIRSLFRWPTPCDRTCRSDITSVTGSAGSASSSAIRLKRTSHVHPARRS